MAKPFVNPFVSGQFLELRVDVLVSAGRGLGRQTVQPCERPGGSPAEPLRQSGTDKQAAGHEKWEQRRQRLAAGKR